MKQHFLVIILFCVNVCWCDVTNMKNLSYVMPQVEAVKNKSLPRIEMLTFERCDPKDEGTGEISIVGWQSRKSRTLMVENTNYTLKIPIDNNLYIKLVLDIWGNGGWRCNGYILYVNSCESLHSLMGEVLKTKIANTKPNSFGTCPTPPGVYYERDTDVTVWNKLNVPVLLPGLWRSTSTIHRKSDKKIVGCLRRVLRATPKVFKK